MQKSDPTWVVCEVCRVYVCVCVHMCMVYMDGTSMRTDPSISGRKYRKLVYNAVFIHNKSLNVVSTAATSASQLKHTPRLLGSICPAGYQIWTIRYGKILVMLLYGKYYWQVYEVYNK